MNDLESPKVKSKTTYDSEMFTYIAKLEQLVMKKRTQLIRERKQFQAVIQSLAKYLDLKGISSKIIEDFLDSTTASTILPEEDEIADWYAQFQSKNQPTKKITLAPNNLIATPEPVKPPSGTIIRISKQDLSTNPAKKQIKKTKLQKEEAKMSQLTSQQQNEHFNQLMSGDGGLPQSMEQSGQKGLDGQDQPKQKRKRRTKKEMEEQKKKNIIQLPSQIHADPIQPFTTESLIPLPQSLAVIQNGTKLQWNTHQIQSSAE